MTESTTGSCSQRARSTSARSTCWRISRRSTHDVLNPTGTETVAVPVVDGTGTGAYQGISGTFQITVQFRVDPATTAQRPVQHERDQVPGDRDLPRGRNHLVQVDNAIELEVSHGVVSLSFHESTAYATRADGRAGSGCRDGRARRIGVGSIAPHRGDLTVTATTSRGGSRGPKLHQHPARYSHRQRHFQCIRHGHRTLWWLDGGDARFCKPARDGDPQQSLV